MRNQGPEISAEELIPAVTHFCDLDGALDDRCWPSPANHAVIDAEQSI